MYDFDCLPYYEGFQGTITSHESKKYLIKGKWEILSGDRVLITELPIGSWTDDYKQYLETLIADKKKPWIKDFEDNSTERIVNITIKFAKNILPNLSVNETGDAISPLEKYLKLATTKTTTNMHAFTSQEKLKKYESPGEIVEDFYITRLGIYKIRKEQMIKDAKAKKLLLSNKVKYIMGVLDNHVDLRRKKNLEITTILLNYELDKIDDNYNYLIKMPMDSVSEENVEKIKQELTELSKFLVKIEKTTEEEMWLEELTKLEREYKNHIDKINDVKITIKKKSKK